jgi:hypothetical protein
MDVFIGVLPFSKFLRVVHMSRVKRTNNHHATNRPPPNAHAFVLMWYWTRKVATRSDIRKTAIVADASQRPDQAAVGWVKAPGKNGARNTNGDFAHAERRTRGYGA